MDHSVDLDGLVYIGRRCGKPGLAMFGDSDSPRRYQSHIRTEMLGELQFWDEFWLMPDWLGVRMTSMPQESDRLGQREQEPSLRSGNQNLT
jgi:hypothetical protein